MITFNVQTIHRVVCWVTFAQEAIFGDTHKRTQLQNYPNGTSRLKKNRNLAQNKYQGCSRNTHTDQKRRTPAEGDDDSADYKSRFDDFVKMSPGSFRLWTEEREEQLCELWEEERPLYDQMSAHYRNSTVRHHALKLPAGRRPDVPTTPGRFHFIHFPAGRRFSAFPP